MGQLAAENDERPSMVSGGRSSFDDHRFEESGSRAVRSVFVSDVHLGTKHARADLLGDFLGRHSPEQLYLVGDFVDGWKLRRRWRWCDESSAVVDRIVELARSGTDVYYTPGNHDDFLRRPGCLQQLLRHFDFLRVRDEFVHETADGRRFLVVHGDHFDRFETGAQWVSRIAAVGYGALLTTNRVISRAVTRRQHHGFSRLVKTSVKSVVRFLSDYESRLLERAGELACDGVICGHVHTPTISTSDGRVYCNTGDWVEHCTALVEYTDGELELVYWDENGRVERAARTFSAAADDVPHVVASREASHPVDQRIAEPVLG